MICCRATWAGSCHYSVIFGTSSCRPLTLVSHSCLFSACELRNSSSSAYILLDCYHAVSKLRSKLWILYWDQILAVTTNFELNEQQTTAKRRQPKTCRDYIILRGQNGDDLYSAARQRRLQLNSGKKPEKAHPAAWHISGHNLSGPHFG